MVANGIEGQLLIFVDRKPCHRDGRLYAHLHRRLRHSSVSDMANLAMLLVGRVLVPMPDSLDGKGAHGENQGDRQQSKGYLLPHSRLEFTPSNNDIQMPAGS